MKRDPVRLAVGVLALAALALFFYFAATGAKTNALVAAGVFALLMGFVFLFSRFRSYRCSACGAPMQIEWHDMKPGETAHTGYFVQGDLPTGLSDDVTYGVDFHPFAYVRTYRRAYVCHGCRRYSWGQDFKNKAVAGSVEGLIEYEEKRSGKKLSAEVQRLAKRMLSRDG